MRNAKLIYIAAHENISWAVFLCLFFICLSDSLFVGNRFLIFWF